MTIPARPSNSDQQTNELSPLTKLTKKLHNKVNYLILPLFAFANSGIAIKKLTLDDVFSPISMGIIFGIFLGKQIGVMLFSYVGIQLKIAKLPTNTSWVQLYGISLLCGIGFTMSLFISSLAFEGSLPSIIHVNRIGIIVGSILSAIAGMLVLHNSLKKNN